MGNGNGNKSSFAMKWGFFLKLKRLRDFYTSRIIVWKKQIACIVTMYPKRQQTKIKFWTKNEFIEISFGQSFWNFVGAKRISSEGLYQKIREGGYKFSFWNITRNLFYQNCLIESFENWVCCNKWLFIYLFIYLFSFAN